MTLKRTRITLTVKVIRDDKLTEAEVIRDFKRQVVNVNGPKGALSDEPHWFAADVHIDRTARVPLERGHGSPASTKEGRLKRRERGRAA